MQVDRAGWQSGHAGMAFGRALYDSVPPAERPQWAGAVLAVAMQAVVPIREVEAVVRASEVPSGWVDGHVLFQRVRRLSLEAEQRSDAHPAYRALLRVAETAAKIAYNASGQPAPFDPHAGWRLAVDARQMADVLRDAEFEERLWRTLSERMPAGAM